MTTTTLAAVAPGDDDRGGRRRRRVAGPGLVSRFLGWEYSDYAVGLVVFAIIFALFYVLSGILFPRRNVLAEYDDLLDHRRELGPKAVDEQKKKAGVAARATQRLLAIRGYQHPLQRLIDDAALKFRASEFALLQFVGVVVVVVILRVVGAPLVVVLVVGLLVVFVPSAVAEFEGQRQTPGL